jgi:HTH-type transcriptional regulator/antitoxin HigA
MYTKMMRELEDLMILGAKRTTAETIYFRMIGVLVADYERSIGATTWAKLAPHAMLRELMELKGISQSQISQKLGDRAAASSILSGRRKISKLQAKKLAELFSVDAGAFI